MQLFDCKYIRSYLTAQVFLEFFKYAHWAWGLLDFILVTFMLVSVEVKQTLLH